MNSVQDKMMMSMQSMPRKKTDLKMTKSMGSNNAEVKVMGKSNQKIRRRMA